MDKCLELVPTKMGQRWDVLCAVLIDHWLRTALWSMLILHCCWPTMDELHGPLKSLGKKVQFLEGGRFEGVWSGCLQQLLQLAAVIQSLSCVRLFETPPGTAACQASLSFAISQSLLKLMSTESLSPSNHLILCCPLLLLHLVFPSIISNKSALSSR